MRNLQNKSTQCLPVGWDTAQLPGWLIFLLSGIWKLRSSWRQGAVVNCLASPSFVCHCCGPWPPAGCVLPYSQRYGGSSIACHVSLSLLKTAASSKYMSCSSLQSRHCFPKLLLWQASLTAPRPPLREHPACNCLRVSCIPCPALPLNGQYGSVQWLQMKSHVFQR